MNKIVLSSIVAVAGIAASTQAETVFQMRLIPDGAAGAPVVGEQFNIGNPAAVTATRIGFWLQGRVSQTTNENWGIVRASAPSQAVGGTSFIAVTDTAGTASLSRGSVNTTGTIRYGRSGSSTAGYRYGGATSGQTGNAGDNLNGGLDNGGSGLLMTRVFGFDAYVGPTRSESDDTPGNPWGVNGAASGGTPYPSDGTFSPWSSLYRVWIDIGNNSERDVIVNASALLNAAINAAPNGPGSTVWAMNVDVLGGQVMTATYTFHVVPTPGAAAMLGLGGLAAMRRRR